MVSGVVSVDAGVEATEFVSVSTVSEVESGDVTAASVDSTLESVDSIVESVAYRTISTGGRIASLARALVSRCFAIGSVENGVATVAGVF